MGKTSLLTRHINGIFPEEYHATIGANFLIKEVDLKHVVDKINDIKPEIKEEGGV